MQFLLALLCALSGLLPVAIAGTSCASFNCDVVAASSLTCDAACQQRQRAELALLYASWGGPTWTHATGWMQEGADHCSWFGVICCDPGNKFARRPAPLDGPAVELEPLDCCCAVSGGVVALELPSNNLAGAWPAEPLPALAVSLQRLRLPGNAIAGALPPHLSAFSHLRVAELGSNCLTSSIPHSLAQLSQLTVLQLSRNQLSSTIPPQLVQLRNLTWLAFEHNQLTGPLPAGLLLLPRLQALHAGHNFLTGSIAADAVAGALERASPRLDSCEFSCVVFGCGTHWNGSGLEHGAWRIPCMPRRAGAFKPALTAHSHTHLPCLQALRRRWAWRCTCSTISSPAASQPG